jgi:molybdate transport system substrate-binding protein
VALVVLSVSSCRDAAGTVPARTLTVFAAASLTSALTEVAQPFHVREPGVAVRFNFAGTQILAAQIEQGARADLFVGADQAHAEQLLRDGRIEAPVVIARNRLVMIVPAANPAHLTQPLDLARRGIKLDLPGPKVPAGAYARQALAKLAAETAAPPGFTRLALANVVSEEDNVEAVVARVALGEVDAGIVYESDLATPNGKRVRPIAIPAADNVVAEYPAAVVIGSRDPALARAFLQYLNDPNAQAIMQRFGFEPAP